MYINLIRDDPEWLSPKIKLLKSSMYWGNDKLFRMKDLEAFAEALKTKHKVLPVEYNIECEKSLIVV